MKFTKGMIMKTTSRHFLVTTALLGALVTRKLTQAALAPEANFDKLANLPFAEGKPTKETLQILRDELLFQRAKQTYLWAMPLINTLGMLNWRPCHGRERTTRPCTIQPVPHKGFFVWFCAYGPTRA